MQGLQWTCTLVLFTPNILVAVLLCMAYKANGESTWSSIKKSNAYKCMWTHFDWLLISVSIHKVAVNVNHLLKNLICSSDDEDRWRWSASHQLGNWRSLKRTYTTAVHNQLLLQLVMAGKRRKRMRTKRWRSEYWHWGASAATEKSISSNWLYTRTNQIIPVTSDRSIAGSHKVHCSGNTTGDTALASLAT